MHRRPFLSTCALLGIVLASCGEDVGEGQRHSAVLITLDTTRADALDLAGGAGGRTPNLARLAAQGRIFTRARSVAPLTLTAHASMLTGLYPPRHTVRDNGQRSLPGSAHTLAELAQEAGYSTGAVIAAGVLSRPFGLGQGFTDYAEPERGTRRATGLMSDVDGGEITRRAIAWLDARPAEAPYFLWVHYFDPHRPYQSRPAHAERAGNDPYLQEVAYMDAAVGRLLDRLRTEPDWAQTVVVVVGDHGEARGSGDEDTHGLLLHDATLRVPLIVRAPGGTGAGERSDAVVSVVDVMPTLAQGMGLHVPSGLDGQSLLAGAPARTDGVYVETYHGWLNYGWAHLVGWADADGLKVRRPGVVDSQLESRLAALEASPTLEREEGETAPNVDISSLGYASGAAPDVEVPSLLAPSDRPDPATRLWEHEAVWEALAEADREGGLGKAIAKLRKVVAANPRSAFAHEHLGDLLTRAKRPAEALIPLRAILSEGLERPSVRRKLAIALADLGRFDEALVELERFEALVPGDPGAAEFRKALQRVRRRQGAGTPR